MHLIDLALSAALLVTGGAFFVLAFRTSSLVRRVLRERTSRVSDLGTGPAEIEGQFRALEPIVALDGTAAVAVHRSFRTVYERDGDNHESGLFVHTSCSMVEVTDDSGTCVLEMDQVLLLEPARSYRLTPQELESKVPDLRARILALEDGRTVQHVFVEEKAVPDGVRGFVSGEATLDDTLGPAGGYRDGKRRFKLRGTAERPLVVSGGDQRTVVRALLRPGVQLGALGVTAVVLAVMAILVPLYLRSRAGL